jgi:NAD(P)-dependent dehydrogenase (short-subunit alcohol dehydrogenase family)
MLQSELAGSKIRVSGLQPGPMRTPLRAKAYVEEGDRAARDPEAYAETCVTLLSPAGASHRGRIWAPAT